MSGVSTARMLRKRMTPWERMLWKRLRNHGCGFHFRRQHQLLGFILDFYCHEARLGVEADGDGHVRFHRERDDLRDAELRRYGVEMLRFRYEQIGADLEECLEVIRRTCESRAGEVP